jgi:hypothetical protein
VEIRETEDPVKQMTVRVWTRVRMGNEICWEKDPHFKHDSVTKPNNFGDANAFRLIRSKFFLPCQQQFDQSKQIYFE